MQMLIAALLVASAADAPPEPRMSATARATATIRVLQAVSLRVGAEHSEEGFPVRQSTIREADGARVAASLVEFE